MNDEDIKKILRIRELGARTMTNEMLAKTSDELMKISLGVFLEVGRRAAQGEHLEALGGASCGLQVITSALIRAMEDYVDDFDNPTWETLDQVLRVGEALKGAVDTLKECFAKVREKNPDGRPGIVVEINTDTGEITQKGPLVREQKKPKNDEEESWEDILSSS